MTAPLDTLIDNAQRAERSGSWNEALELYEEARAKAQKSGNVVRVAEVLRWVGRVYRLRGDLDQAADAYGRSLAVAEANGLTYHIASALNVLAVVEQAHGQVDKAEELYGRARTLAIETGDDRLTAMIEQNFATMANIRGETKLALASYAAALERYQRVDDVLACAYALNNMGMAHTDRGEWREGAERFKQALAYAIKSGDAEIIGTVHLNAGELCLKSGDIEAARDHCGKAFEIFSRLPSKTSLAETYKLNSAIHVATGKTSLAEIHLTVVVELARACNDRLLEAEIEHERALLYGAVADHRQALQSLNRAHEIFTAFKASKEVSDIDRRLDRIEQTYLQLMQAWGDSIESKHIYGAGHSARVAGYACALARALGFAGRDVTWLRMGVLLHDIGLSAVPVEILNKPGTLTAEEFETLKRHTVIGDELVSETPFPWDIRPIVRNHHEHWNGTGYPDRLAGEEIPLTARIVTVADVFAALTSARSYRGAYTQQEALDVMQREVGTVLDPKLFELFRNNLSESGNNHG